MAQARNQRIESEIQRVLAGLIAREVKDPRVGNITITAVSVATDKSSARVFFTPFASSNPPEQVASGLSHAAGFLRGELGRRLGLRHAPRLEFVFDESIEGAARLSSLIDRAVSADRAAPAPPSADSAAAQPATAASSGADLKRR
jgi:ribosome-binding factor A